MGKDVNYNLPIDTSTKNGANGASGRHGGTSAHGESGGNGVSAQHAADIALQLSADQSTNIVTVVRDGGQTYSLPLGDPAAAITIKANGGKGGNGGAGGSGGGGLNGCSGMSATQYSYGTNGSNGGPGGNGGRGGNGGDGGNAGNLTLYVDQQNMDLLMLVTPPELKGGVHGAGGAGGKAGKGGEGGSGGASYTWFKPVTRLLHDTDGKCRHVTDYVPQYMAGGSSGSHGSNGTTGEQGPNGKRGKDGKLKILVNDAGVSREYPGRYKLALDGFQPLTSDGDIIEPDQELVVDGMTVRNTGPMPTPVQQSVQISLIPNQWVDFKAQNTVTMSGSIAASARKTLQEGIAFRVKSATEMPATDTTFERTGSLQFKATLSRVNKNFDDVSKNIHNFTIRYPVEISTVVMPKVIAREEEAPFAIAIRNISSKPIGINAENARLLEIDCSPGDESFATRIMSYQNADHSIVKTLETPVSQKISCLNPGETAYFTGTIKFDKSTPAYTTSKLTFKLHLGKLNRADQEQEVIQQRNVELQLADSFQFKPDADLLLVTNNKTSQETIQHWTEIARMMGTNLSIWNTSLYAGMSYTKKINHDKSFIDQMQGKVVVILNNEMNIGKQKTRSTDCLDAMEILDAAKKSNVSTYVIGQGFDLQKAVTPQVRQNDPVYFTGNYFFWQKPTEKQLLRMAAEYNQRKRKEEPDHRYLPVVNFQQVDYDKKRCALLHTWKLGSVEMRETLNPSEAHIAVNQNAHSATHVDLYNIIKLLPFAKKLQYLNHATIDVNTAHMVSMAILSDLTDELLNYAKDKWNGGYTWEKLSAALVNLKALSEHQFTNSRNLSFILMNYENIAHRLPTNYDKYLFPFLCRRTRLSKICQQSIHQMLAKHFPAHDLQFERETIKHDWEQTPREQLFEKFSLPYKNDVTFDNQVILSDPVLKKDLPSYQENPSKFREHMHFFADTKARTTFIEGEKPECKFDH